MRQAAVFGIVLSALTLLGMVPVSLEARREGGALELTVWAAFIRVRLRGKRKKTRPPEERIVLIQNAYTTLCRIVPRLRVDELRLRFTAAFSDPALTAAAYGAAGAAMEVLGDLCTERVGTLSLQADADFMGSRSALSLYVRVSARLYRLVGEALCFGARVSRDRVRKKTGKGDKR